MKMMMMLMILISDGDDNDAEGDDDPCNARATSYCSNMSGSFICNSVKQILKEEPYCKDFSFNFQTMSLDSTGLYT